MKMVISSFPKISFSRKLVIIFFLFFLLYYSGSRFNLDGYELEYVLTARNLFHGGEPILAPGFQNCPGIQDTTADKPIIPRQNLLQCYLSVPFYALGAYIFGEGPTIEGRHNHWDLPWGPIVFIAMLNPLLAAGTIILIIISAIELGFSHKSAVQAGLYAGIATMFWPYAGLGMEVFQTFFLTLSVFTALKFSRNNDGKWLFLNMTSLILLVNCKKYSFIFVFPVLIYICYQLLKSQLSYKRVLIIFVFITLSFVLLGVTLKIKLHHDPSYPMHLYKKIQSLKKGSPIIDVVWGLLISPSEGVFTFNPILLFAIPGWIQFHKNSKKNFYFFIGIILILFLAVFKLPYLLIDEEWGPRYFHAVIPLLILAGTSSLVQKRTGSKRAIFIFILIISIIIQMLGVLTFGFRTWDVALALGTSDLSSVIFVPSLSQIYIAGYLFVSNLHRYLYGTSLNLRHYKVETFSGLGGSIVPQELNLEYFDHPVGAVFTIRWVLAEKGYHVFSEQTAFAIWFLFVVLLLILLKITSDIPLNMNGTS